RKITMTLLLAVVCLYIYIPASIAQKKNKVQQNIVNLQNESIDIQWKKHTDGWRIERLMYKSGKGWVSLQGQSGEHLLLYSTQKPDTTPVALYQNGKEITFPEPIYHYNTPVWREITSSVQMNRAGVEKYFYPDKLEHKNGKLIFHKELPEASVTSSWHFDAAYPTDIVVEMTIQAKANGHFSTSSPTLLQIDKNDLSWATIPGFYQGNSLSGNFVNSYAYGHGIPDKPVLVRERTATTLTAMVSIKDGITVAAV